MSDNPQDWSPERLAKMAKIKEAADQAQMHRSAGGLGMGSKALSDQLFMQGGLLPQDATTLSRYKMFMDTTGGDPNWQGPLMMNTGAPEPIDTPEDIAKRNEQLFAANGEGKKHLLSEMSLANERGKEHFYDKLTADPLGKRAPAQQLESSLTNALKSFMQPFEKQVAEGKMSKEDYMTKGQQFAQEWARQTGSATVGAPAPAQSESPKLVRALKRGVVGTRGQAKAAETDDEKIGESQLLMLQNLMNER